MTIQVDLRHNTPDCAPPRRQWSRMTLVLLLALRLPFLALAAYLFRFEILEIIERNFGLERVTLLVIDQLSTLRARLAIFILSALFLGGMHLATARLREPSRFAAVSLGALAWFGTMTAIWSPRTFWLKLTIVLAVLVLNILPDVLLQRLARIWRGHALTACVVFGFGLVEVACHRAFQLWLTGFRGARHTPSWLVWIPGILITSLTATFLLRGGALLDLSRSLHSDPRVEVLAAGDFNGLELDPEGRFLYVTGHGLPRIQRYDTHYPETTPLLSTVATGGAQSFALNPSLAELCIFNPGTRELLVLETPTLRLKESIPISGLSPGDVFLATYGSGSVVIASEADEQTGSPMVIVERPSGQIFTAPEESGNILLHPRKPYLYLSRFRRNPGLAIYDLDERRVRASTLIQERLDRMHYLEFDDEILLASPVNSRLLRYDASDLSYKGYVPAHFGIRSMAVDRKHGVILGASLATGYLAVIDMAAPRSIRQIYLGPWLRSIVVDETTGNAYISSNGALFRARYLED